MIAALFVGILQILPATPQCVFDEVGVLTSEERSTIELSCSAFPGGLFVVIPANLRGQGDKFASNLLQSWGARSDSAMIMVAPNDKKWRIVVGAKLNLSSISDEVARIGQTYGVPAFKRGQWGVGIIDLEAHLIPMMQAHSVFPPEPGSFTRKTTKTTTTRVNTAAPLVSAAPVASSGHWAVFWVFIAAALLILLVYYISRTLDQRAEERDRREYEDRLRRANYQTSRDYEAVVPPRVYTPSPSVSPIPVMSQTTIIQPTVSPAYHRGFPVVVIEEPILSAPIVELPSISEEVVTTTTTVQESSSSSADVGGDFGSVDVGSSFDSGSGFDSGDSGGSGGDF